MVNRIRQTGTYIPARRLDCASYDSCLNQAATLDVYDLGCGKCDRYEPYTRSHLDGMIDSIGCWALLIRVFGPEPPETDPERLEIPSEHLETTIEPV